MRLADGEVLLRWPLEEHRITAGWYYTGGSLHGAIDLRTARDGSTVQPVYVAEAGTVDWVQAWDGSSLTGNQSYGNLVRVRHAAYHGKKLQTYYAHLSKAVVGSGQAVAEGQLLGYSGQSGYCLGAHLHFEVRLSGKRVNPLNWLDDDFTCVSAAVARSLGQYTSVARYADADGLARLRDVVVLQASAGDVRRVSALAEQLGLAWRTQSE